MWQSQGLTSSLVLSPCALLATSVKGKGCTEPQRQDSIVQQVLDKDSTSVIRGACKHCRVTAPSTEVLALRLEGCEGAV